MLGRASLWALKATVITLPWTWNEISWRDSSNADVNAQASAATQRFVHSVLQDIPQVKDKKVVVRTWPFGVYSTGVCFLEYLLSFTKFFILPHSFILQKTI